MSDKTKKYGLVLVGAVGWITALFLGGDIASHIDPEQIKTFAGDVASNELAQSGMFFTIAAWIHSGRVKKEISSNFSNLTSAINNAADSLRDDLKNHSDRLDNLSSRVQHVENSLQIKRS